MIWLVLTLHFALAQSPERIQAGRYLVQAAGCRDCHTRDGGAPFSGGLELKTPFGTFVTPNITFDGKTGIGRWTPSDFRRAIRLGLSPEGTIYYPAFPYGSFTKMTAADVDNIYLYLQSLPQVQEPRRPNRLKLLFDQRWLLVFWRLFYFSSGTFRPVEDLSDSWNRGAYLVEAVLHCAECHTPRGLLGGLETSQWLAGSDLVFAGKNPPNITPDPSTGLVWSKNDWRRFLASGFTPKGREMSAEMALVIRETTGLTPEDREAVVEYMTSLPPIKRFNANE